MIRQRIVRRSLCSKKFTRSTMSLPMLTQFAELDYIPRFMSKAAFELSWKHYQTLMLMRLQKIIAGGSLENKDPKDIALEFARDPNNAAAFNYASMAHNNHFFFESIARDKSSIGKMDTKLREQLIRSFGSIDTLKQEMLKTANAMFGPGFVWLIKDFENKYTILATYLAGSPYPQAYYRQQPADIMTESTENLPKGLSEELKSKYTGQVVNQVGQFGPLSKSARLPPGAPASFNPVLCINTWEHTYLPDYGLRPEILGGKQRYLENWWNKIDWRVVSYRAIGQKKDFVQ
ncbi:putative 37S ribosomal protein S26A, mitochondrial [Golovinomyces cichoracearum]|uniref:Putative 37S ribosomal protein S26A, mitochondrial n=1 Tax=Golovinomyces cichoracearum TaxID=62708 RepID=A0A420IUS6_9PEZI|nr:putative 37S ribosomal protein S26A, mitochondrial [Golovinomyces cichoracearum]